MQTFNQKDEATIFVGEKSFEIIANEKIQIFSTATVTTLGYDCLKNIGGLWSFHSKNTTIKRFENKQKPSPSINNYWICVYI